MEVERFEELIKMRDEMGKNIEKVLVDKLEEVENEYRKSWKLD